MENKDVIKELKKINGGLLRELNVAKSYNEDFPDIIPETSDLLKALINNLKKTTNVSQETLASHITMTDFPKLECPLVRKHFKVDKKDWKKIGRQMNLRKPEVYLVTDDVSPGFEWVFNDPDTFAVEKLNGTNVKVLTENGLIKSIQNRANIVDPSQTKGQTQIMEGIYRAASEDYIPRDGETAGELIGKNVQSNDYNLSYHVWYPFDRTISHLRYNRWDKIDKGFESISDWMRHMLGSIFYQKTHKVDIADCPPAEGVIFYNLRRKAENKSWRCKLRRDMYDWYYEGKIKVFDYSKDV